MTRQPGPGRQSGQCQEETRRQSSPAFALVAEALRYRG